MFQHNIVRRVYARVKRYLDVEDKPSRIGLHVEEKLGTPERSTLQTPVTVGCTGVQGSLDPDCLSRRVKSGRKHDRRGQKYQTPHHEIKASASCQIRFECSQWIAD